MRKKKACKGKFYNVNYLYTLSFYLIQCLRKQGGSGFFRLVRLDQSSVKFVHKELDILYYLILMVHFMTTILTHPYRV